MHLANQLLHELEAPDLSLEERAMLRCRLAKQYEQVGGYEVASEQLAEFWQGVGVRPNLEGLSRVTQAEVLLRVGALTGWIGSALQIAGSQEAAKDLITESLEAFAILGRPTRVGEARSDLARCYWREGAFDEARALLKKALEEVGEAELDVKATALSRLAVVEFTSRRLSEALRIYRDSASLFDQLSDHFLIASYHHGYANVLNQISESEQRNDYVDLALIEYAAASFHFEQAGHERFHACVENNLGYLYGTVGRFHAAHEHLDRAQMLMTRLKDDVHLAQVDETRARVLLAENRSIEAERAARSAVSRLEKGDALSLLAEALTTHGNALAQLRHLEQSRESFERAISVAEQVGDFESAGLAVLNLIEQLGDELPQEELRLTLDHARVLMEKSEDVSTIRRIAKSAFQVLYLATPDWENFSFRDSVFRYEAFVIKQALKEAKGRVSHAARLLGFKHHQSLISLLQGRHKSLLPERKKPRNRRVHLLNHSKLKKRKRS